MNEQILSINNPALLDTEISKEQLAEEPNIQIKDNLSLEFILRLDLATYYPDLSYSISEHGFVRIIRIGNFPFQPCGGTHGAYLNEIKNVTLTRFKLKNELLKNNYDIA